MASTRTQASSPRIPSTLAQRLQISRREAPYRLYTVERVLMTPELAQQYLDDFNTLDMQRDIRPLTLSALVGEALMNAIYPGTSISLYMLVDGTQQIVNGQHRLQAIVYSGITVELVITTYSKRRRATDAEASQELYESFDRITTDKRSLYDYARVEGLDKIFGTKTLTNRWVFAAKAISAGCTEVGMRINRGNPRAIFHVARQFIDETKRYFALTRGVNELGFTRLTSVRVMPVMLILLKHAPRLAKRFIQGMRDLSLRASDPRKQLRILLLDTDKTSRLLTSTRLHANAISIAWRAFVTKQPIDFSRINEPLDVIRTPYRDGYMPPHPLHSKRVMDALKLYAKSRGVPETRLTPERHDKAARRKTELGKAARRKKARGK